MTLELAQASARLHVKQPDSLVPETDRQGPSIGGDGDGELAACVRLAERSLAGRVFFDPDRFTFGQHVYLSAIYAAAYEVPGVDSVTIQKFQRLGLDSTEGADTGQISVGRLEIARLDNDPNFPENGVLTIHVDGGR